MTEAIDTGWHHAAWLLGYLLGWSPILVALLGVVLMLTTVDIPHRLSVHRIRRQTKRSGRT